MPRSKRAYRIILLSIIGVYVALMAVFTFFDYQITDSLFHLGTGFGRVFEAIGPMFMPWFMIYATVGLIMQLKFQRRVSQAFAYIGLGFSYLYATFMGVMTHQHSYAPWMFVPSIVLYVLFTVFVIFLNHGFKKASKETRKNHIAILFVMFIVAGTSLMGVDIVKCIFGRVRYINLADPSDFKYWFYINKFDFNSSFPSGHAARAMTTVCFSLIPLYFGKKKLAVAIEVLGIAFAITVSISRMVEGMHYPTDIVTGLVMTYLAFFIGGHHFLAKKDEPNGQALL